jgi:hypothetical protein
MRPLLEVGCRDHHERWKVQAQSTHACPTRTPRAYLNRKAPSPALMRGPGSSTLLTTEALKEFQSLSIPSLGALTILTDMPLFE